MSTDTLVIICKTIADGKRANRDLERFRSIDRFFVFLEKPEKEHPTTWIEYNDQCIVLPIGEDLPENQFNYAVRAGFVYSSGFNVLFCFADNTPSSNEISEAGEIIDGETGFYQGDRVWGCNRSYMVTMGFDMIYNPVHDTVNLMDLSKAMSGAVVNSNVAIAGVKDVIPLHSTCIKLYNKYYSIVSEINALGGIYDPKNPSTIILGDLATEIDLIEQLRSVGQLGVVVLVTDASWVSESAVKPYQVFNVDNGQNRNKFKILCYRSTALN